MHEPALEAMDRSDVGYLARALSVETRSVIGPYLAGDNGEQYAITDLLTALLRRVEALERDVLHDGR